MRIGIVTGASSGLGRAFARQIDRTSRLDELWLIARREDRLKELAGELHCRGRVFALDLTDRSSSEKLQTVLEEEQPQVDILVCAAGFGKFGRAQDLTERETDDMIALNCRAAVEVTRVCLPYLDRGGRILEICSCAAFEPLPGMNLYAATKAFLLRYTRALRWEVASRGIRVTAVCPCWVRTEFESVARDSENGNAVGHFTKLAQRPESVAAWALSMNRLGLAVATCGPLALVQRAAGKLLPSCVTMAAWEGIRRV